MDIILESYKLLSVHCDDQNDTDITMESYKEFLLSLPKEKGWIDSKDMYLYQGFWYHLGAGLGVMAVQERFKARPTDIFLISAPKSGTIWLKTILFATMNRTQYKISHHPLLTTNPHNCVPFLELNLFQKPPFVDVEGMPSPRLFGTHIPLRSLPHSIESSGSRMIYLCRNPKDVLVSMWQFMSSFRDKHLPPLSLDEVFKIFCDGKSFYGPFWDHAREYRQASLVSPHRIFFITYEEMKRDSVECTKRLAQFLGCPFSMEEENSGVVKDILRLCSFNNLRNLEINKSGCAVKEGLTNNLYFRRGEVGDSEHYLTTQMIETLDSITKNKLDGVFI